MTQPDKLFSIGEAQGISQCYPSGHQIGDLARQLADAMRAMSALGYSFNNDGSINVPLTTGGHTIIDSEDLSKIGKFPWRMEKGYAVYCTTYENGRRQSGRLHRLILNAPEDKLVDHINGDRLDNRKTNLRLCNDTGNARNASKRRDNTSGFKGVTLHKETGKWQASIRANGNPKYLGLFDTPEEASKIYDAACLEYHGEFAKNNDALSYKESGDA